MTSSQRKHQREDEQLGMNTGVATHLLKKQMMLRMAQRLGWDYCHICGEKIEKAEDLGVDHIISWRGQDNALFWDLDNVAFCHRRCNVKEPRIWKPQTEKPSDLPEEQSWCSECKQALPVENFSFHNRDGKRIPHSYCRPCRQKRRREGKGA